MADVSARTRELEQIVEGLWQKGYDLKKAGMGWVIREPLGSQKVELSSDNELLEFVSKGYKTDYYPTQNPPPIPATRLSENYQEASFTEREIKPRQFSPDPIVLPGDNRKNLLAQVSRRHMVILLALLAACALAWWAGSELLVSSTGGKEHALPESQNGEQNASQEISTGVEDSAESIQRQGMRSVTLLTNAERVISPKKTEEPMIRVADSAKPTHQNRDLSVFAEHCKDKLKERFGLGSLSLLINVQGRHADNCYVIDEVEHCPYVSRGQATLNFIDDHSASSDVYACDIHLEKGIFGNFRRINANPDIVRFIIGETSGVK